MIFNSVDFAIFFVIVFVLYWFAAKDNMRLQNLILLTSSYFFYAYWDWRFLFLLVFISLANFYIGLLLGKRGAIKYPNIWFIIGLILNIGILSYFKYFNFFISGFIKIFSEIGVTLEINPLRIILPLGISFYIFLSISYLIDIYQGRLKPCQNIFDALLTFSFFPILLAGPIQRPVSLLPQIQSRRAFNYSKAVTGLKQILWGLFMKIVIADRCAIHVNDIFQNYTYYSGSTLMTGSIFFTIQVYADFAGYSLIAIGISGLLGFDLMNNFSYPYFARSIADFWKRWHISLTTWFRDYIFLPVSYKISRRIKREKLWFIKTDIIIYILGITTTWILTGLWHGGNYTFIVWGLINGFFLILYHIARKPRNVFMKKIHINKENLIIIGLERLYIIVIILLFWIFFRADSLEQANGYLSRIFDKSFFTIPHFANLDKAITTTALIIVFLILEWIGRDNQFALAKIGATWRRPYRYTVYYLIIFAIFWFGGKEQQFIYFQF